jgi:ribonuclease BN (tRNA processing enzyme)
VFSGDTAYSENLIELARGADVFVCEVLGTTVGRNANATVQNNNNTESIARHVPETHSTPEEVGRMAAAAKVKTLVLSHQVGGGRGGNTDPLTADLKKIFSGEVIVGADQMRL